MQVENNNRMTERNSTGEKRRKTSQANVETEWREFIDAHRKPLCDYGKMTLSLVICNVVIDKYTAFSIFS